MKLRLRIEIEKARTEAAPEERDRLDRALEELELARIGTIHAFCGDLLAERPVEAGIDPLFKVPPRTRPRHSPMKLSSAGSNGSSPIRRRARGASSGVDRAGSAPQEQLRAAMHHAARAPRFPQPWRRDPFDRNGAIDALMDELAEVGELAATSSWPDDYLARNLAEIALFVEEATRLEAVRGRDYDGLEAELRDLAKSKRRIKGWEWKGAPKTTLRDAVSRRQSWHAGTASKPT